MQIVKDKISTSSLQSDTYISTENILPNFAGVNDNCNIPDNQNVTRYKAGDILLANIRPYLKKIWLADRNGGCNADVFVFRPNNINSSFVYYSIANDKFCDYVMSGAKGVKMPRGDKDQILKFETGIPSDEEQQRIVQLLSLIDERIATQNKIIEDLKKLKSAIIDCHFNGRKANNRLGDLIHEVSNRNKRNTDLPVLSVSNRQGFIAQSEQFENRIIASDDTSNYKIVIKNDFAYNPARINVGSIARLVNYESGIVSPMYICFRCSDEILPEYLELFFQSRYFQLEVEKRLEGSVRQCLSIDGIKSIQFGILSISEQKVFAEKLKTIQTKLDNEETMNLLYQAKRKYLLSNMFI